MLLLTALAPTPLRAKYPAQDADKVLQLLKQNFRMFEKDLEQQKFMVRQGIGKHGKYLFSLKRPRGARKSPVA